MPVLARSIEAEGLSTILVTMMPFWAEKIGVPRTLAVEFPFGHTLGQPHNLTQQMRVIRHALEVLEAAEEAGTIVHSPEVWLEPEKVARARWQPKKPSPIVDFMAPKILKVIRQRRE